MALTENSTIASTHFYSSGEEEKKEGIQFDFHIFLNSVPLSYNDDDKYFAFVELEAKEW